MPDRVKLTPGQRALLRDLSVNGPRRPEAFHRLRLNSLLDKGLVTLDGENVDLLPAGWAAIRRI
jgi:hypothetical protein